MPFLPTTTTTTLRSNWPLIEDEKLSLGHLLHATLPPVVSQQTHSWNPDRFSLKHKTQKQRTHRPNTQKPSSSSPRSSASSSSSLSLSLSQSSDTNSPRPRQPGSVCYFLSSVNHLLSQCIRANWEHNTGSDHINNLGSFFSSGLHDEKEEKKKSHKWWRGVGEGDKVSRRSGWCCNAVTDDEIRTPRGWRITNEMEKVGGGQQTTLLLLLLLLVRQQKLPTNTTTTKHDDDNGDPPGKSFPATSPHGTPFLPTNTKYPPIFLPTYLPTHLSSYPPIFLPTYLTTVPCCLSFYLPACLPFCLSSYLPIYISFYRRVVFTQYLPAYLLTYLPTYLPTFHSPSLYTCLPIYLSSYLLAYLSTTLPTYRSYLSFCMYLFYVVSF